MIRFLIDTTALPRKEAADLCEKMKGFAFLVNEVFDQNSAGIDVFWDREGNLEYIRSVMNIPDCCPIKLIT